MGGTRRLNRVSIIRTTKNSWLSRHDPPICHTDPQPPCRPGSNDRFIFHHSINTATAPKINARHDLRVAAGRPNPQTLRARRLPPFHSARPLPPTPPKQPSRDASQRTQRLCSLFSIASTLGLIQAIALPSLTILVGCQCGRARGRPLPQFRSNPTGRLARHLAHITTPPPTFWRFALPPSLPLLCSELHPNLGHSKGNPQHAPANHHGPRQPSGLF